MTAPGAREALTRLLGSLPPEAVTVTRLVTYRDATDIRIDWTKVPGGRS